MFKINWTLITSDECEKLQRSLNVSFAKLKLPDYVSKISVSEVNLGDVPPVIELMDICAVDQKIKDRVAALAAAPPSSSPASAAAAAAAANTATAAGSAAAPMVSSGSSGSLSALSSPVSASSSSLALSGSGGHHMSRSSSFTPQTLALHSSPYASPGSHHSGGYGTMQLKPSPMQQSFASPGGSSGGSAAHHPAFRRASTSLLASPPGGGGHYSATLSAPLTPIGSGPYGLSGSSGGGMGVGGALPLSAQHDEDLQIKVKLHYNGNASFNIHSGLVINWPSPGFASLPITLRVSKLSFEGNALIIKVGQTAYFTFENDPKSGGPLKDVCVESDIGDADKSVLRNARKVEQFIITQLQTMLREKCVYPRMIPAPLPVGKPGGGAAGGALGGVGQAGGSATPLASGLSSPLSPSSPSDSKSAMG